MYELLIEVIIKWESSDLKIFVTLINNISELFVNFFLIMDA